MRKFKLFIVALILVIGLVLASPVYADTVSPAADVTDLINGLTIYSAAILGVLGALSFAVQVIVQVTKEVPPIGRIPTKLWVIIVSLVVCELALFIYASWVALVVLWYYIVLAAFMSMVVAYIAINGWDTLMDLYRRYRVRE